MVTAFKTKGKFSEYQLTRKETLPTFRLDALVFFRAKVKLDANTCYLLAAHIKKSIKTRHRMSREVRGRPEPTPPCNLLRVAVQQPGSSSLFISIQDTGFIVVWFACACERRAFVIVKLALGGT